MWSPDVTWKEDWSFKPHFRAFTVEVVEVACHLPLAHLGGEGQGTPPQHADRGGKGSTIFSASPLTLQLHLVGDSLKAR